MDRSLRSGGTQLQVSFPRSLTWNVRRREHHAGVGASGTVVVVAGLRETVARGGLDQTFPDAARRLAWRASAGRPSPSGAPSWSAGDIDDLVSDTIARVTPAKLVLAANKAPNDKAFAGYVIKALRTTLDLRARGTPEGRVIRAVDEALSEDPVHFRLATGHWCLCSDDREPCWSQGLSELIDVAWTVETRTTHFSPDAEKTPPLAARDDTRAVAAAVLERSGPLPKAQLAEVLAARFNVAFEIDYEWIDDPEQAPDIAGYEGTTADERAAQWMHSQLTADERQALAGFLEGGGIRGITKTLGCSKHRAGVTLDRLKEKLARLADACQGDARAATEILLRLCRTSGEIAAFSDSEEP